jgi:phosphoribosylamine---glycine ligase
VLIVGGGGREHALAWKLGQSPQCNSLYCAPGNPGIAEEPNVSVIDSLDVTNHEKVASFCTSNGVGLVMVGPEAPLVDGLVDSLAEAGVPTFGPTKAAARLEGSKVFMKELCHKYGIPAAESQAFENTAAAHAYIMERGAPIVVKASGLAAGKGVILAQTVEEAKQAATEILEGGKFGSAGKEIIIEDLLQGEEASYFALIDGSSVVPIGSAQDHKAAYDGDKGPNTGGMGAYSPAPVVTPEVEAQVCFSLAVAAEPVRMPGTRSDCLGSHSTYHATVSPRIDAQQTLR